MDTKTDRLRQIKQEIIQLVDSPLYNHRQKHRLVPVIGEGSHDARIIFIAEAPGINEAKTGRHFVGQAGKIFDQLLKAKNISRQDIYITNIIKDKLPGNRNPNKKEINAYAPFLLRQIAIIQPKIIVTLGTFSTNYILSISHQPIKSLKQIHGKTFKIKCSYGYCHHLPTYHPASCLYNSVTYQFMVDDLSILKLQNNDITADTIQSN